MKARRYRASLLLLLAGLWLGTAFCYGQVDVTASRAWMLGTNTGKLDVKLTLDCTEYLPGEAARVTISITNSTNGPLEVFDPFHSSTGSLEVYARKTVGGKATWQDLNPEPLGCVTRSETLPNRFVGVGEKIERVFNSYDGHFETSFIPLLDMPETPGDYELVYTYGKGSFLFTVTPAIVELLAHVPLSTPGQATSSNGKKYPFERRVTAVVLGVGGMHHVVV